MFRTFHAGPPSLAGPHRGRGVHLLGSTTEASDRIASLQRFLGGPLIITSCIFASSLASPLLSAVSRTSRSQLIVFSDRFTLRRFQTVYPGRPSLGGAPHLGRGVRHLAQLSKRPSRGPHTSHSGNHCLVDLLFSSLISPLFICS